jgi:hypothetical protein
MGEGGREGSWSRGPRRRVAAETEEGLRPKSEGAVTGTVEGTEGGHDSRSQTPRALQAWADRRMGQVGWVCGWCGVPVGGGWVLFLGAAGTPEALGTWER